MAIEIAITENENSAFFAITLSVMPAEAGIQVGGCVDSRVRGNDKGEGLVLIYQGSIFITTMTPKTLILGVNRSFRDIAGT